MTEVKVVKDRYTTDSLYQYDKNQELVIYGLSLPSIPEIHFSNSLLNEAIVKQARMDNAGIVYVDIPNEILTYSNDIDVYVCIYEGDAFKVLYKFAITVKARTKPADYIAPDDEKIYSYNALENKLENTLVLSLERYDEAKQNYDVAKQNYDDTVEALVEINIAKELAETSAENASQSATEATGALKEIKEIVNVIPVKGEDYWTEADQSSIIDEVIEIIGGVPVFGVVNEDKTIVVTSTLQDGIYTIKYEDAEGNVTDIGKIVVGGELAYVNVFDANGATLNSRWSNSSYGYTTENGYVVSAFIPVSISDDPDNPTVLRFRGGLMASKAGIAYFDASKTIIAGSNASTTGADATASQVGVTTDENGDYQTNLGYKNGAFESGWKNASYIRVTLQINSDSTAITEDDIAGIIMTIDEAIV